MSFLNRLPDLVALIHKLRKLNDRDIALAAGVAHQTVRRYRRLLAASCLKWPALQAMDGAQLDAALNASRTRKRRKLHPDYSAVHREMVNSYTSLIELHDEFLKAHPGQPVVRYAQMARCYRHHVRKNKLSMRQKHVPGECVQIDFIGLKKASKEWVEYQDPTTGKKVRVELFAAVAPYSAMAFVVPTHTQRIEDTIHACNEMLKHFGGVPATVVCDNFKSAVVKAGPDPVLNRVFRDWAAHNGTVVLPARPRHPRDKGAVEGSVRHVKLKMLRRLRRQTFFSMAELETAVAKLLKEFNAAPFQKRAGSRDGVFQRAERPRLSPLPLKPFAFQTFCAIQRVPSDYHVLVLGHFYSVPHGLVNTKVEPRYNHQSVEIFASGKRVAVHPRCIQGKGEVLTLREHQPPEHQARADSNQEGFERWADGIGPQTGKLMRSLFQKKLRFDGLMPASALRNLAQHHQPADFEVACQQAIERGNPHPTGVRHALAVGSGRKTTGQGKWTALTTKRGKGPFNRSKAGASAHRGTPLKRRYPPPARANARGVR